VLTYMFFMRWEKRGLTWEALWGIMGPAPEIQQSVNPLESMKATIRANTANNPMLPSGGGAGSEWKASGSSKTRSSGGGHH